MKSNQLFIETNRSQKQKTFNSTTRLKLPKLRFGPYSPLHYSPKSQLSIFKPLPNALSPLPKTFIQHSTSNFLDDLVKRHKSLSPSGLEKNFQHLNKSVIQLYWSELPTKGQFPESRSGAIILPFSNTLYLLSGERSDPVSDLYRLPYPCLIWEKTTYNTTEAPTAFRCTISVGYKEYIIVYGGYDYYNPRLNIRNCCSLLYFYNTVKNEWKSFKSSGNIPEPRRNHCGCIVGESFIIFSGQNSRGDYLHDTQILDLKTLTWLSPEFKGTFPPSRIKSSLTAIFPQNLQNSPGFNIFFRIENDDMPYNGVYLFGGKGENGEIYDELFLLRNKSGGKKIRYRTLVWSKIEAGNGPSGRFDHSAGAIGKYFIVFAGRNDSLGVTALNDLHLFNVQERCWENVEVHGKIPTPRFGTACTVLGSKLIVFGGMSLKGFVSAAVFELETNLKKVSELISNESRDWKNGA